MQHALVGSAVAEESHGDPLVAVLELGGECGADGQRDASGDDAVGAQHALAHIGDMHRAALALVGAGGAPEELGHHALGVNALGDAVAVSPVGAADVIVIGEVGANAGGDGLLPGGRMHGGGHAALAGFRYAALLKVADGLHGPIEFQKG